MFRENVLVKKDVIDRVSETMIPVALDYQKVLDRQTPEARFLLPLMKQRDQEQGLWIFSPDGKALGGFEGFGAMHAKTKRLIEDVLHAFGPVEPRKVAKVETHPHRGKGFRSDGSVCLAEYVRRRDPSKIRSPVISSVILSRKEFETFAPLKAADGKEWTLLEAVAKKLCRVASPMCYQHAPQPDWVKAVAVKARVRTIRNGLAELSYEGKMSSERTWSNGKILSEQALTLKGEGVYDIGARRMKSLLIVGVGTFRWPEEAPDEPVPFDALIEWESQPPESATKD